MTKQKKTIEIDTNPERDRILNFVTEKFFKEGFYKISIDSLASELRVSKKTFYKYFKTKEHIIELMINNLLNDTSVKIEEVIKSDATSLNKALKMSEIIGNVTMKLSENWINDIRIHMPQMWQKIDEFRAKRAYAVFSNIIEIGKKEGNFVDKPCELIVHLFVNAIRSIVNPQFIYIHKFSIKEAFQDTFEILFNGILTTKGRKEFNKIFVKVIK